VYWFVCGVKNLCEEPQVVKVEMPLPPPPPPPPPEPKPEPTPPPPEPEVEIEGPLVLPDVYFIFDRDIVKNVDELMTITQEAMEYLTRHPDSKIYITGHTCNTGDEQHNYDLGLVRAEAVKKYMITQGVSEDRIIIKSMGASEPKIPNESQEDKMENRRVHIIVK